MVKQNAADDKLLVKIKKIYKIIFITVASWAYINFRILKTILVMG